MEYLIPSMRQKVTYLVEAAAITVDGKEVVIVENQEEANAVFETLQSEYIPEDTSRNVVAGFKENVQVVLKYVDPSVIVAKES